MPLVSDPVPVALASVTAFFLLLGILIIFVEDFEIRFMSGLLMILLAICILFFAVGLWDIGSVVAAIIAAIVSNHLLERYSVL